MPATFLSLYSLFIIVYKNSGLLLKKTAIFIL